jgi:uncharacterized protein DUF6893
MEYRESSSGAERGFGSALAIMGCLAMTAVTLAVLANLHDIKRYIRMTRM